MFFQLDSTAMQSLGRVPIQDDTHTQPKPHLQIYQHYRRPGPTPEWLALIVAVGIVLGNEVQREEMQRAARPPQAYAKEHTILWTQWLHTEWGRLCKVSWSPVL